MRKTYNRRRAYSGLLFDFSRRALHQACGPSGDLISRTRGLRLGGELLAQNHMRNTQGQHAFCSRPACDPLIGIRAGLRHARLDLHKLTAASWSPPAHLTVTD